jgi:hypothetical protein
MRCTLLIPHLFWPRDTADSFTRDLDLRSLTKLLARASCTRHPAVTLEAWLCEAFEVERQQDWPIAPLTLELDRGEPGNAYWLRADPVHVRIATDRLVLADSTVFELTHDESQTLAAALDAHFSGNGIAFRAPHPRRWYARLERTPRLATHALREARGRDVRRYLPTGADALAWHTIANEAQMVLHAHPINEQRESRGEPPVNSVWFWGGGTRAGGRSRHFDAVWSIDATATALAAITGIETADVPADGSAWLTRVAASRAHDGSHLVLLDDLDAAAAYDDVAAWRERLAALEARWFTPIVRSLRSGRIEETAIIALGDESCSHFAASRASLMKLWRRPKPLSAYA